MVGVGVAATLSCGCGGGAQCAATLASVTSVIDSEAAQKMAGDDTQPVGRPRKNRTRGSWPGGAGRTMPNCLVPLVLTLML